MELNKLELKTSNRGVSRANDDITIGRRGEERRCHI
jgi:hypothetical protein